MWGTFFFLLLGLSFFKSRWFFSKTHNINRLFFSFRFLVIGTGVALMGSIFFTSFTLYGITSAATINRPVLLRLAPLSGWLAWLMLQTLILFCQLLFFSQNTQIYERASQKWRILLGTLFIFGAAWFARGFGLDHFVTIDEPLWMRRGTGFYLALKSGEYADIPQSGHPGVTVMWAKTLAINFQLSLQDDAELEGISGNGLDFLIVQQGYRKIEILAASRLMIALLNAVVISLTFVFAARIFSFTPAFFGALLLAFNPFHVAHTRLLSMDGTLSSFAGLCVFAFLCFTQSKKKLDLLVSGGAAGFAWLTKSPGFFLVPMIGGVGILTISWASFREQIRQSESYRWLFQDITKRLIKLAGHLLLWGTIGMLVFTLLFPSMWVIPIDTITKIFAPAFSFSNSSHRGAVFFAGSVFDGQIGGSAFFPTTYLWRTTPIVIAGLVSAFWIIVTRKSAWRQIIMVLFTLGIFVLLQNISAKKFDRYFLIAYPLLDYVSGVGLAAIASFAARRQNWLGVGTAIVLLGGNLMVLGMTFPYYLSYYNPLMGGPSQAPEQMMIGWGEGLDEAARYLNSKPNLDSLEVISWYNQGSFSYFFDGESQHIPINQEPSPERLSEILQMDYAVIYIHQWQRRAPENLLEILSAREPEHSIWINGLEYVRIYKLDYADIPSQID